MNGRFTMISLSSRGAWRLARWLRPLATVALWAAVASVPARAQGSPPPTLRQALDAAWSRAVEAAESRGWQDRARAEQAVMQGWLAGPPAASFSQREGLAGTPPGHRESALGVALPLWRPGERAAGEAAAQAQGAWAEAWTQAQRLRLAGQLRETAAAVRLAEVELGQAERQVSFLRELTDDVVRREQAGDLAPADTLAARAELLAAQAQVRAAQQTLQTQQATWRWLTGLDAVPAPPAPATGAGTAAEVPESHPDLALAALAVQLAQRRLDRALAQRPGTPEVTVGMRQEQPGAGAAAQGSVVLGLRWPVGGERYQQPRIAAERSELAQAEARAQRTRERLAADLRLAASQSRASQLQLEAARERAALLAQRARWIERAFRAGESPLPELLRAWAAAAAAEAAQAREQVAQALATARHQHALGELP